MFLTRQGVTSEAKNGLTKRFLLCYNTNNEIVRQNGGVIFEQPIDCIHQP